MITITPNSGFFNGVEFFNYSQYNIVVTDQCGIETEIIEDYDRAPSHQRGKVVVRVTKVVDPRRVTIPSKQPRYQIDAQFLETFSAQVKEKVSRICGMGMDRIESKETIQVEMTIDMSNVKTVTQSHFFGFSVRAEKNKQTSDSVDNATSDIKKYFIPAIEELDKKGENYDDIVKTVSAVRLVDSKGMIGDLWTSVFGTPARVIANKRSKLDDGLYITAGLEFEHVAYIPIETLDTKTLLGLNLHKTKLEAQQHSTGEFTIGMMTRLDKIRKENRELDGKVQRANETITEMKAKQTLEAQKTATTISDIKIKNHNDLRKQGGVINDLKRTNNRMIDDSIRARTEHREEIQDLKRNYDKVLDELKENKKTNVVLDIFRTVGSFLGYLSGAAKLFAQLCF